MLTKNTMAVSEKSDTKPYRLRKRKERKVKEKQVRISSREKKNKMNLLGGFDMKPLSGKNSSSSAKETNDTISKSLDMNFTVQNKERQEPKITSNSSILVRSGEEDYEINDVSIEPIAMDMSTSFKESDKGNVNLTTLFETQRVREITNMEFAPAQDGSGIQENQSTSASMLNLIMTLHGKIPKIQLKMLKTTKT